MSWYFVRCVHGVTINGKKYPHGENEIPHKDLRTVMELDAKSVWKIPEKDVPRRFQDNIRYPIKPPEIQPVKYRSGCSIIVAVHKRGSFEFKDEERLIEIEQRCLESVRKHTDLAKHDLIVVENDAEPLGHLWNRLIAESEYGCVCLLNSDTVVEAGWLEKLMRAATLHEGVVGPLTNKCGNPQQISPEGVRDSTIVKASTLSGFCLVFPKWVWEQAGGFREDYPFYGQESNFLERPGVGCFVCRDVFVHHESGATISQTGRRRQEMELASFVHSHNKTFPWHYKLAVLGAGEGNPFPLWRGVDQALIEFRRQGMECKHYTIGEDLEIERDTDLVIVVTTTRSALVKASQMIPGDSKYPTVLWFNDLRPSFEKKFFKKFRRLFLCWQGSWEDCDSDAWEKTTGLKVSYMPQGSVIHPRLVNVSATKSLPLFIGGTVGSRFHHDRKEIIDALHALTMNERIRRDRVHLEQQCSRLYREHDFCLAISPPAPYYNSIRLYNILAYGGLALVKRFPGIHRLFENHKHLLAFDSVASAQKIIEALREDDIAREKIRRAGWRQAQAKHTVAMRLMNIMHNYLHDDDQFWGFL